MDDLKKALIFQIENSTAKHPVDLIQEVLLILYSKGFADGEEYMENREDSEADEP